MAKEQFQTPTENMVEIYTTRLEIAKGQSNPEIRADGIQFCQAVLELANFEGSTFSVCLGHPDKAAYLYIAIFSANPDDVIVCKKIWKNHSPLRTQT
ncbi:MAG: hypothetical protein JKY56_18635 [Kofleriaceae bacterium]|nr:hypothetical protein [Kofleriaceae bacterium]